MASLSLRRPALLQIARPLFSIPYSGTVLPSLLGGFGGASDTVRGLWDSILRAVPKKKTSHSKTRMRSATKALKPRKNINTCSGCGAPKLAHTICLDCFHEIKRRWAKHANKAMGMS